MSIEARKADRFGRIVRGGVRLGVTFLFVAAAGALAAGGAGWLGERAAAVQGPEPAPELAVRATQLRIEESYSVARRFVGQIEPAQQTEAAFEFGGVVTEIAVDEGDRVAEGEAIARLDRRLLEAEARRLRAQRAALAAQAELARRTADRRSRLNQQGFASDQALDQAALDLDSLTARIAEIDAALAAVAIRLEKAVLRAPFDGRVSARHADVGAAVANGQPLLTLVETRAPRFRVGLDPDLADRFQPGDRAVVEIGGRSVEAVFTALTPALEPTTRTRTALFALPDRAADGAGNGAADGAGNGAADGGVAAPFGQTGRLALQQPVADRGAWAPVSALKQGVRGLWTVLTVEGAPDAPVVGIEAVEILHSDGARVFLRGTFADGALVIVDGPHRTTPGQRVRLLADADP